MRNGGVGDVPAVPVVHRLPVIPGRLEEANPESIALQVR
jgi:hypothetical protein